jgi:bifunctional DNase/RNase
MQKIELEIVALSHSITQSQNYAVVLGEMNGQRRLPIVIGAFEAQAIAVAMEQMLPSRPLTHDLIKSFFLSFQVDLKEIIISNLVEGIFYARLVCVRDGELVEIDSRTSDALALAVRFDCPIYTYEFILDQAGVVLEAETEQEVQEARIRNKPAKPKDELSSQNDQNLEKMLQEALANEDYKKAALIRDEINKRKGA